MLITPGSPYPGKFLNTIKTDSKGIATIKYKLTEFGYNTILVQSDEIIPSYGGGDNTAMCDLYVYKSFLKQSNNVFVKNRTIGMKSYFKVFGLNIRLLRFIIGFLRELSILNLKLNVKILNLLRLLIIAKKE